MRQSRTHQLCTTVLGLSFSLNVLKVSSLGITRTRKSEKYSKPFFWGLCKWRQNKKKIYIPINRNPIVRNRYLLSSQYKILVCVFCCHVMLFKPVCKRNQDMQRWSSTSNLNQDAYSTSINCFGYMSSKKTDSMTTTGGIIWINKLELQILDCPRGETADLVVDNKIRKCSQ